MRSDVVGALTKTTRSMKPRHDDEKNDDEKNDVEAMKQQESGFPAMFRVQQIKM